MKTTQRLKQQIYKQVLSTGLYKQVQSKLKTQVLNIVDRQSNNTKKALQFQYQHPLLSKLRKYPLTSLCIDLIQQFLQSFKFKYTLSVFRKQINQLEKNINRLELANHFHISINNPQAQAVLLSIVSQLVTGDIQINNKNNNAFAKTNNTLSNNQYQTQPRLNNFIGNNNNTFSQNSIPSNSNTNFNKKPVTTPESSINNSFNDKSKSNTSSLNNSSQQQTSNNNTSVNQSSVNQTVSKINSSSSNIDLSIKPSENSISQVKQQNQIKQTKDDKNKKNKKKKQIEKPPEGATDLMGQLMSKFKTKDTKTQQQEKKKKIFQQKRAFSQQKAKKVVDPSQSGANKIRGVSMGKMSNFMNKFMPASMNPIKNDSYIEQQLDEFQQSKDSTRKNPLFSSSQSGFDKSGYYDMSVDSNAINDFQYVQKAKKFTKKT